MVIVAAVALFLWLWQSEKNAHFSLREAQEVNERTCQSAIIDQIQDPTERLNHITACIEYNAKKSRNAAPHTDTPTNQLTPAHPFN